MAFGKWAKVEGNIATQSISKDYLSVGIEISSHLFPLISSHEAAKVYRLNSFRVYNNKIKKKVKNPANIFKYFKYCLSELEALGGGQFVDFLCEDIGEIHI